MPCSCGHNNRSRRRSPLAAAEASLATWAWSANQRRRRPHLQHRCLRPPPAALAFVPVLRPRGSTSNNITLLDGHRKPLIALFADRCRTRRRPKPGANARPEASPSRKPTCTTCTSRSRRTWLTPDIACGRGSSNFCKNSNPAH